VEYRILGPLEVRQESQAVALGGLKQRALLAVLLLNANRTVSSERLIDEVWGDDPPKSATKGLHFYIFQLRTALEPGRPPGAPSRLLVTHGSGYELRVDDEDLDLRRFERLVATADRARESGDHAAASKALAAALDLWRGPPLADLASQPVSQAPIARLGEARLAAVEDRCEAELALGHHTRLIGELERLVADNPLRERLHGQLMLALYRSGRQAEALDVYRKTRGVLVEELGIEPNRQLQQLERAILAQDPALELPESTKQRGGRSGEGAAAAPATAGARRRRPGRLVAAAVAVGVLAAGVVVTLTRGTEESAQPRPQAPGLSAGREARVVPTSVVAIDPGTNHAVSVVQLGAGTQVKAVGEGACAPTRRSTCRTAIWVANIPNRTVSRIDPESKRVVATISVPMTPDVVVTGEGHAWVAGREGNLLRIDLRTNVAEPWDVLTAQGALHIESGTALDGAIAVGHDALWIGVANVLTLWRTDAKTGEVLATMRGIDPRAMVAGEDALWVLDSAGRVSRINARTNQVAAAFRIGAAPRSPAGLAIGEEAVWVLDTSARHLLRVDPAANNVAASIPVNVGPTDAVTAGGDAVWVTQRTHGAVLRIDPATNQVVATIRLGHAIELGTIGFGAGRVWVAVGEPLGT
jgi:DNA-binding SARP family transcriptional activator/DNA-binding beta-propeller fold protein YncE